MPAFRSLPSTRPFRSVWGSWITALALVFLAVAGNTSFTVFARAGSETRAEAAWIAYRPWRLSHGKGFGGTAPVRVPDLPGAWCARAATEGSSPWGRWIGEVITCIHAQFHHPSPAAAAGPVRIQNKEHTP